MVNYFNEMEKNVLSKQDKKNVNILLAYFIIHDIVYYKSIWLLFIFLLNEIDFFSQTSSTILFQILDKICFSSDTLILLVGVAIFPVYCGIAIGDNI